MLYITMCHIISEQYMMSAWEVINFNTLYKLPPK